MKILATIRDSDVGSDFRSVVSKERKAARALVFDKEGRVALLHATKKNFHKLPGGGVEEGEDVEGALRREVQEEIGCQIENLRELDAIEEYRGKFELHQISYCFLADLAGNKGLPELEEDEIVDGFEPVWMSLDTAIKTLEAEAPVENYEGKFIQKRDLLFLNEGLARTSVTSTTPSVVGSDFD